MRVHFVCGFLPPEGDPTHPLSQTDSVFNATESDRKETEKGRWEEKMKRRKRREKKLCNMKRKNAKKGARLCGEGSKHIYEQLKKSFTQVLILLSC